MAATTSSQCFPIQAGVSFAGEPCGHAELPSVEGCCALCERTPSCLFFTHWSGLADTPSRCELYSTRTDSQLAPEHATVTSGALPKAHWLAPSAAACRFSTPEPGTLASAPLTASQAFATLEAAQAACVALDQSCTGVTGVSTGVTGSGGPRGRYRVRGGSELQQSPTGELASFKVGCDGAWCDLEEGEVVQYQPSDSNNNMKMNPVCQSLQVLPRSFPCTSCLPAGAEAWPPGSSLRDRPLPPRRAAQDQDSWGDQCSQRTQDDPGHTGPQGILISAP